MATPLLLPSRAAHAAAAATCASQHLTAATAKEPPPRVRPKRGGGVGASSGNGPKSLVLSHVAAGRMDEAADAFAAVRSPDAMGALALACFEEMNDSLQVQHDSVGIIAALAACCLESALMQGREIHGYAIRRGLEQDVKVGTSLLDMYSKCGNIAFAENVFAMMPSRTVVTWNCMIGGYALNERPVDAFDCFMQMRAEGFQVEVVTAINLLAACAQAEGSLYGRSVHAYVIRRHFLPHVVLETALLEMYGKVDKVESSEKLMECVNELLDEQRSAWVQNTKAQRPIKLVHGMIYWDIHSEVLVAWLEGTVSFRILTKLGEIL
ncbi:hypothetical protein C2845_PM01G02310 [Panicum miliaceum]|uniref:Pentatricopeptide repeat-containing protein n=1 Tax=Panicum miliaceum TaxID=4540 RepID=A0A3L6TTA3_PANMI|nr:hypothetical protein C2845_PM01G02310 [Panicum miliaceum]